MLCEDGINIDINKGARRGYVWCRPVTISSKICIEIGRYSILWVNKWRPLFIWVWPWLLYIKGWILSGIHQQFFCQSVSQYPMVRNMERILIFSQSYNVACYNAHSSIFDGVKEDINWVGTILSMVRYSHAWWPFLSFVPWILSDGTCSPFLLAWY